MPLMPSEAGESLISGPAGLHSRFQDNQSYRVRPYLKNIK